MELAPNRTPPRPAIINWQRPNWGLTRLLYSDEWLTAQKYIQEEMTAME